MKFEPLRSIRYHYLRFIRLQGDPHIIAKGVAIGIFVGITPTIPLHTILAIGLSLALRGSKVAALLLTIAVSNPLTFFFQYYFSWKIGNLITFKDLSWDDICTVVTLIDKHAGFHETLTAFNNLGQDTLIVLLIGGVVLALPFAVAGYILAYVFFTVIQKKRRQRGGVSPTE